MSHRKINKQLIINDLKLQGFVRCEQMPSYLISPDGKIYSTFMWDFIKSMVDALGYETVTLQDGYRHHRSFKVHRLVAQTFIPNPNHYKEINHKDGNKLNNTIDNLEWCNRGYNIAHAYKLGLRKSTIQFQRRPDPSIYHKRVGLFVDGVLMREFSSEKEAGEMLNVPVSTVSSSCHRKRFNTRGKEKYDLRFI